MKDKNKLGLASIILLGINAVIGSGIFLLPGKAMKLMGVKSMWVYVFSMILGVAISLCFAEVGGMFKRVVDRMCMLKKPLEIL